MRIALIIPTYNAGPGWQQCLDAITMQTLWPDIRMVIDSHSTDQTLKAAKKADFEIAVIGKSEFNHGGTRMQALKLCGDCDLAVYLTQDAILTTPDSLKNIIDCFSDDSIAAVCGRQLPRRGAGDIEAHARIYNYPDKGYVRSIDDREIYGLKTAFLSNSFAAYRVNVLNEVGGFPDNVIFGEDMYVAARILKAGYKIAYAADACVYHSHSYSFIQEFKRYFDMGVFHAREPWIRLELGGAEGEGLMFVQSEFKYLLKYAFWQIPEGILRTLFRYVGYRLGLLEKLLPLWLKKSLAMNKGYFNKHD